MSTRIKFTKAAIKNLPIPASNKQYDTYYDEEVKKLMLLVYPSKNKTFFVSKKVGSKAIKYKLGTYPDLSIENARKLAQKALGEFADGKNPQQKKRQYQKEMTFESFFKQYCKDSQKKSIADDEKYYRLYLQSDWANKRLSEIKLADIEEKHRHIGENYGKYAANHTHSLIRTLYNRAITKGIFVGVNPAKGVERYREKSRDRFLQPKELPYFFEALSLEQDSTIGDFFLVLLFAGQRRANTLAMRWKDINFDRAEWYIADTKNYEPMRVHLNSEVLKILKVRKEESASPWVFPGIGKTGHYKEPRKGWVRVLKRARIMQLADLIAPIKKWSDTRLQKYKTPADSELDSLLSELEKIVEKDKFDISEIGFADLRIHDLRRTMGSWQAITGATLQTIGKALGHKTQTATAVYAHLNKQVVNDAVDKAVEAMINTKQAIAVQQVTKHPQNEGNSSNAVMSPDKTKPQ